ncbi:MAG: GGDEF domain-containing protein [Beijerinckiaceae bacterium]
MYLHVPTILFLVVLITLVTGVLLLFSWCQNRSHASLAWWGSANLVSGVGAALLMERNVLPNILTIDVAGALLLVGYGGMLGAARRFCGKSTDFRLFLAGAAMWLACCRFPAFHEFAPARVFVFSSFVAAYSWAAAFILVRGRSEPLPSRFPAAAWMTLHGLFYAARLPFCLFATSVSEAEIIQHPLFGIIALEAIVHVIALSFLQAGMEKERSERRQRLAAETDELTGAANRRSVLVRTESLLESCRDRNLDATILLLDLDHFKSINDSFGHDVGDSILKATAQTLADILRKGDVFGRIGGEEFVCCLPNASAREGRNVAERIRSAISSLCLMSSTGAVRVTASIGIACTDRAGYELSQLMKGADEALYEAKEHGRDRVADALVTLPRGIGHPELALSLGERFSAAATLLASGARRRSRATPNLSNNSSA